MLAARLVFPKPVSFVRAFANTATVDKKVNITDMFFSDDPKVQKDGVRLMKRAASTGNAKAQFAMGMAHMDGISGLEKSTELAMNFLKRAADQGHALAQFHYSNLMKSISDSEHLKYLKLSANNNCAEAINAYVVHLIHVQKNDKEAIKYLEKGVALNDPVAQFSLAVMLFAGRGTATDCERGWTLLLQSKEQGYEPAIETVKKLTCSEQ